MAIKASGAGIRAGTATKKIVVCRGCGAKTATPAATAGNVRCDGCGNVARIRR